MSAVFLPDGRWVLTRAANRTAVLRDIRSRQIHSDFSSPIRDIPPRATGFRWRRCSGWVLDWAVIVVPCGGCCTRASR